MLVLLAIFLSSVVWAKDIEAPQKFRVIFTITYNEMTLEQASEKEIFMRNRFRDSCNIDVSVNRRYNVSATSDSITTIIPYGSISDSVLDLDDSITPTPPNGGVWDKIITE